MFCKFTIIYASLIVVKGQYKTVEKVFLEFNSNRQHRDLLLQARAALRLYELEKKHKPGATTEGNDRDARDRVGKAIGMSGRNLNRYFRILKTPIEVQDAFRKGKIQLVVAEKVSDLDGKIKKSIAKRIQAGEDAKAVVTEYLPQSDGRHQEVGKAVTGFVRGLQRGLADLDGRLDRVGPAHVAEYLAVLQSAQDVLQRLISKAKEKTKSVMEAFADCFPDDDA